MISKFKEKNGPISTGFCFNDFNIQEISKEEDCICKIIRTYMTSPFNDDNKYIYFFSYCGGKTGPIIVVKNRRFVHAPLRTCKRYLIHVRNIVKYFSFDNFLFDVGYFN